MRLERFFRIDESEIRLAKVVVRLCTTGERQVGLSNLYRAIKLLARSPGMLLLKIRKAEIGVAVWIIRIQCDGGFAIIRRIVL